MAEAAACPEDTCRAAGRRGSSNFIAAAISTSAAFNDMATTIAETEQVAQPAPGHHAAGVHERVTADDQLQRGVTDVQITLQGRWPPRDQGSGAGGRRTSPVRR